MALRYRRRESLVGETPRPERPLNPDDIGSASGKLLEDYVRPAELAHEFDCSERTIDRWVRRGLLPPPIKLGRMALFHVPTVREHFLRKAQRLVRRGR